MGERDETDVLDKEGNVVDPLGEDNPSRRVPRDLKMLAPPKSGVNRASKDDLLAYYLAEVRRWPLLEPEEEKELAVRWVEDGDKYAAERLVTANLRLVVKLAFQYHRQWSNVLDLIQEGNVGLVEALSRYDPYRGIRFSSYAQYWIRAMILRYLMDNYRMVRLGSTRHGRKLFFQLNKEKARLISEGLKPSTKKLAERLSVPEQEIINVDQHLRAPAMSFDAPAGSDADGRSLKDVVPDAEMMSPVEQAERAQLGSVVKEKLDVFAETLVDDREHAIWFERLTVADPIPLSRLGERFGVSKERIRQIEARMRKRLRAFLEAELGDEIDFEFSVPKD
ncbi:MAG: sigma-70 family RNA polymerase sigma factor [Proteobacteria bacterium]|nr:sigma-70 family RNA polymerase sigma factor [Pseudomonadota bacterium]MCP4920727.1 sigma-70 family RNA polymerase sigma factor [Pseudomonadota bacterium]